MRILLIDNYDSFTYNLYDYINQLDIECTVLRNNELNIDDLLENPPDAIIISPGPGLPQNSGSCMEIIDRFHKKIPILGICLGHQALGLYFGARLEKGLPMHGKTSEITHSDHPVFNGLPGRFEVMRYHSLILEGIDHSDLKIIASTENNEVMAIAHKMLPLIGFQFHPESILTPLGMQLLQNWTDYIKEKKRNHYKTLV